VSPKEDPGVRLNPGRGCLVEDMNISPSLQEQRPDVYDSTHGGHMVFPANDNKSRLVKLDVEC